MTALTIIILALAATSIILAPGDPKPHHHQSRDVDAKFARGFSKRGSVEAIHGERIK